MGIPRPASPRDPLTRKGYATSVRQQAANGCAVAGLARGTPSGKDPPVLIKFPIPRKQVASGELFAYLTLQYFLKLGIYKRPVLMYGRWQKKLLNEVER